MIEPACASRCSQIDTFLARNRSGYRRQRQALAESNPTACAWQPFPSRTLPKDPCHRWFRGLQVGPDIVGQRRSKRSAEHRPPCACGYGSNGDGVYPMVKSYRLTAPRREARQSAAMPDPRCHYTFDHCRAPGVCQFNELRSLFLFVLSFPS